MDPLDIRLHNPHIQFGRLKFSSGSGTAYRWRISLLFVDVGATELLDVSNSIFFLESSSFRLKGEAKSIRLILDTLLNYKNDASDQPFTSV